MNTVVSSRGFINTAKNGSIRSLMHATRIVNWYISAIIVGILFYIKFYFYSLPENHNFITPLPPQGAPALKDITRPETFYKKILHNKLESKAQMFRELQQEFRQQWYRQRKARVDWEKVLRPCLGNMAWGQIKQGWGKSKRSSASRSSIYYQEIRPAREFSRILIQSRAKNGQIKSIGGDTWRVYVHGPSSVAATVFDHNNGTYEALFLLMEPGNYRVEVILDYSLCDGFRDPPVDWFILGNSQGKYQKDGILGHLDDYLIEKLDGELSIYVTKPRMTIPIENILSQTSCNRQCEFLMDGYGRWINDNWLPFLNASDDSKEDQGRGPSGIMIVYGDSLAIRFGSSLASNKKICGQLYKSCSHKYNWVYPVGNEQAEKLAQDDLDFNDDRVLKYIREVLEDPDMNHNNSALVINMGLHFVMSINFTTYQQLIDNVIRLVLEKQNKEQNKSEFNHKARVVWKTTTAVKKENARSLNLTHWRFFTTQRILLFDSYAIWAMCQAGIPVLDVYPVTDSYPSGPRDVVHYPNYVFNNAEKALEIFKSGKMDNRKVRSFQIIGHGLSIFILILANNVLTYLVLKYTGCTFASVGVSFLIICGFFLLSWYTYADKGTKTSKTKAGREFLMDALRSIETSKIPYVVDRFLELDKAGETNENEEQEERLSRIPLDSRCVVCLSSETCITTLPCSHTVTCGWCAWQSLKRSFENGTPHRCVICRAEIIDFTGSLIKNLMNIKWKDVRKIVDEIKE